MTDPTPTSKSSFSAEWLFRGVLTKLGDAVDSITGRRWVPSSSLATSQLIERLKKLLDSEARQVSGKGLVVPHNISLKMQWDKFSEDSGSAIELLRDELLAAAADHINDSNYYTLAPLALDVKTDYFTEGVKLSVSFDTFDDAGQGVEMNVTLPSIKVDEFPPSATGPARASQPCLIATYSIHGIEKVSKLDLPDDGRISVGRTAENALVLEDSSVSKMHASIVVAADSSISVADTGSTNGTFVNGQRLAYGRAATLILGDRIRFGTVDVSIENSGPPAKDVDISADPAPSDHVVIDGFQFRSRSADAPAKVDLPENASLSTNAEMAGDDSVVSTTGANDTMAEDAVKGSE